MMRQKLELITPLALLCLLSACATSNPDLISHHQRDMSCPAELAAYCGGWSVYAVNIANPEKHISQNDRFVIGRKSNGQDPLAVFPRPNLMARWNGQRRIALREIKNGGAHECMVGRVRLAGHIANRPHEWHALTVRVERITKDSEIGSESSVKICLNPQSSGGWPNACAPIDCKYPDNNDPRNHGGRAHAVD